VNISLLALSSTAGLLFFREKRLSSQVAQKYNNNNSSCNSSSSSGKSNSINISFVDSEASPKLSKLRKVFLLANLLALLGIIYFNYAEKKVNVFPSTAGMSQTKISLAGNNLSIPGQGEFG
jgi:hypothetical protein